MSNSWLSTVYSVNKIKRTGLPDNYNMNFGECVSVILVISGNFKGN